MLAHVPARKHAGAVFLLGAALALAVALAACGEQRASGADFDAITDPEPALLNAETCSGGWIVGLADRPLEHGIAPGDPLPEDLLAFLAAEGWHEADFERVTIEPTRVFLVSEDPFVADPDTLAADVELALVPGEHASDPPIWLAVEVKTTVVC